MNVICYLSNGYPSIEASREKVDHYYAAGCRMIEMDLPSVDPYLEGELIGGRMKDALKVCSDYDKYLETIADVRATYPDMEMILLAYEDTMESIGIEKLVTFCLENGIEDVIVVGNETPDLKKTYGSRYESFLLYSLPPAGRRS